MRLYKTDRVPLLLTMDLEIARDHDLDEQREVLERLYCDLEKLGARTTVFTTAEAARFYAPEVRNLAARGLEIACHGLDHAVSENYRRMSPEQSRANIQKATQEILRVVGSSPRCFRGPRMTTSVWAQKALLEYGYLADFSVCSRRIDVFTARGGDLQWLFAPRLPYSPSPRSPYRRGNLPLLVVPLSCLGAPFLSGILYTLGLGTMKTLFRTLLREARRRKKPIVYLFHSYEFAHRLLKPSGYRTGPGRPHTGRFLHSLYMKDRNRRYERTMEFFEYMLSQVDIVSMTGTQYVESQIQGSTPEEIGYVQDGDQRAVTAT